MQNAFIARHGDVDIKQIKELPKGLKKIKGTTLALGEVTGHHHTLVKERESQSILVFESTEGIKYFQINEPTSLTHQEHKTLVVNPGIYEVKIEQEFDPFADEIKKVAD